MEARLREFIISEIGWGDSPDKLTAEFDLTGNHVLDSMGIMRMVAFIEDEWGVRVEDDDLLPENFSSLAGMTRLLNTKLAT